MSAVCAAMGFRWRFLCALVPFTVLSLVLSLQRDTADPASPTPLPALPAPAVAAVEDAARGIEKEAQRVFSAYPFLEYTADGLAAVQDANKQFRVQEELAYPPGDQLSRDIGGREGLHLFYTTDCTQHSLWQSLALEHTWEAVKQPGALTRLVSGCYGHDGAKSPRADLMSRRVTKSRRAFVFFAPRVGGPRTRRVRVDTVRDVCGSPEDGVWHEGGFLGEVRADSVEACMQQCASRTGECSAWNWRRADRSCHLFSSRGTRHEDAGHVSGTCRPSGSTTRMPGYLADYAPINRPATALFWLLHGKPRERFLGLLDPDMVFVRPLLFHISGDTVVQRGRPVGQFYDYLVGGSWTRHYADVCKGCPALGNSRDYSPGPPHFMHRADWEAVAPHWLSYTVAMKQVWGQWISEMAGMSTAMARFELRSRFVMDGMWDRPAGANRQKVTAALRALGGGGAEQWVLCAKESEYCELPPGGPHSLRYGSTFEAEDKPLSLAAVPGGSKLLCTHKEGTPFQEPSDPAPNQAKSCWYFSPTGGQTSAQSVAGAANASSPVHRYIDSSLLPSLFHYCFTFEVNKRAWTTAPESQALWRFAAPQVRWEAAHDRPLLEYMHWSKYRALTDWGGRRGPTLLDCGSPMLFEFPPLPVMLAKHSPSDEDKSWQLFFATVLPAINSALVEYKARYCVGEQVNHHRTVRTAHDSFWITPFETVFNDQAPGGFSFRKVELTKGQR